VSIRGKDGWGISFHVTDAFGARQFGHAGGGDGQSSLLTVVPEHDFAVVVLANANMPGGVPEVVVRFAIKQYLGIEMKEPEPILATEKDYQEYVGRYTRQAGFYETVILGGRLLAQYVPASGSGFGSLMPPMPLELVGKDRMKVTQGFFQGNSVDFIRNPDGSVGWLRHQDRISRKRV